MEEKLQELKFWCRITADEILKIHHKHPFSTGEYGLLSGYNVDELNWNSRIPIKDVSVMWNLISIPVWKPGDPIEYIGNFVKNKNKWMFIKN